MELRAYLALLAKRWTLIATVLVLSVAAAAASILLITPSYRADAKLFVSTQISAGNLNQELFQGSNFSTDRVKSYTELATSPTVLDPVITELGLPVTAAQLAGSVQASVPLETVLIDLSATSNSPDLAAALANSVAGNLAKVIEDLETSDTRGSSPVKATVVTPATVPTLPAWPSVPVNLGLGVLVGLLVGVGLAVLLENLNTSIKNGTELAAVTGAPVLATVARDVRRSASAIVRDDPLGSRSEAYRQLRTNLQFASVDDDPKVIVVTSALAGEGKSSVAGNLALALSQVGTRVCLVDGDLRRPSVASYFGLVPEAGLSTVLVGRAAITEVLQPVDAGVDAVTSGEIPPNPTELLSSRRFPAVLRELADRYDIVLVDAPPTLPAADAAVLAAAADGVLFVVHADRTTRQQVERAVKGLAQVKARLIGAVLNMVPVKGQGPARYWAGDGYTYRPDPKKTTLLAGLPEREFVAAGVSGHNGAQANPAGPMPSSRPRHGGEPTGSGEN